MENRAIVKMPYYPIPFLISFVPLREIFIFSRKVNV